VKKNKTELELRPLKKDDLNELIEVYFGCFEKKVDANYFEWKYFKNPAGEIIGTVACDNKKVVALYGLIPDEYIVNGQIVKIYQAMDIMVHPSYQGMGLFTRLSLTTSERIFHEMPQAYFIGYPGESSYYGFTKKAGWANPANIRFNFTHSSLFKWKTLLHKNEKLKATNFNKIDEQFDNFFLQKEIVPMPIQKKIDKDFLNWRCFSPYTEEFKGVLFENEKGILGYVIYKIVDGNRCFLHFMDSLNKNCYSNVLYAFCKHIFSTLKSSFIFCFEATNPLLKAALRKNGFIYNPYKKGPFSYRPPLILHSNQKKVLGIDYFNAQNWDIQGITRDY
jgi:hypothetical protein